MVEAQERERQTMIDLEKKKKLDELRGTVKQVKNPFEQNKFKTEDVPPVN